METNEIKKLIVDLMDIMKDSKLSELEVEMKGTRVKLCREGAEGRQTMVTMTSPAIAMPMPGTVGVAGGAVAGKAAAEEGPGKKLVAPMVGTFYQAPSPEADPYVSVGDTVEEETVVCIIEAMKVMNEIKAEMKGKVVEVLVNNGEAVEYGQPLFIIEPIA